MKEKLQQLMKSEGLTSSRMAEILGIQPSGISHILAGRNKPGFDLLQKILRRFPRVNPDWLLLDSDKMYRDSEPEQSAPAVAVESSISDGLFGPTRNTPLNPPHQEPASTTSENPAPPATTPFSGTRTDVAVRRIVILYDDLTFESFTPTKR